MDNTEYLFDSSLHLKQITENGLVSYRFQTDSEGQIVRIEGRHHAVITLTYSNGKLIQAADAMGNATQFTYEGEQLKSLTNPDGKKITFVYDQNDNILAIADFSGSAYLTNEYDESERITAQTLMGRGSSFVSYHEENSTVTFTDELENQTVYTYDTSHNITAIALGDSCIHNSYNADGRLIEQTDALGNSTKMEYDECGRMNKVEYPDGTQEQVLYNEHNYPVKTINRDGTESLYTYDDRNNLISAQDERGNQCQYAYDAEDNLTAYTDKNGNIWTYTYDSAGHLEQASDPEGNICRYSHDAISRLLSYTSPSGRTTTYQYAPAGDLVSIKDADGTILFSYDNNGSRTGMTDRRGNQQRLEYNKQGQLTLVTDFQGNEYHFAYDDKGNLIQETDPLGYSTAFTYDAMGNCTAQQDRNGGKSQYTFNAANQLTQVQDASGAATQYTYDSMGQVKTVIDPLANQTSYSYDNAGRITSVTDALGNIRSYTYDALGNLLTKTDEEGAVTSYTYDNENHLITITTDDGTTSFIYDKAGRVTAVADTEGNTETAGYDADDNLTSVSDKENRITTYTYNESGRLAEETAPNGAVTKYTYDANGNCISITDAENNKTTYEYDENNHIIKETDPLGNETVYSYDARGALISVTDANGGTDQYEYDGNGNIVKIINPLGDAVCYTYDSQNRLTAITDEENNTQTRTYDAAGNIVSYTDANGNCWEYRYDALNRLIQTADADGKAITVEYTKTSRIAKVTDTEGAETSYSYDTMGRLLEITDALGHKTAFGYDRLGRMISQTDENGNTTEYSYSPTGNITSVKNPEGGTSLYTYNELGRMQSATDALGNTIEYQYDKLGQVVSLTDSMGAQTAFTYNKNGQIATVTDADGGVTQYSYDACGNLIQTIDPMGNVVQYAYDAMNNQIKECRLSEEGEQTHITLYQYDKRGGMIREIDPLLAEKTYTYDGSGNIISMVDEEENETTVRYNLNHLPVQINYYNGRCDNGSRLDGSQNNGSQNNGSSNNRSQNNGSQNNGSQINSKEVKFRYNSRGELVEMKDWNGTAVLEHDSLGRLTKITDHNNRSTGYSYDPAGNITGIVYPDGSTISRAYDKNNRLKSVTDPEGILTQYGYDAAGNLLSINAPGSSAAFAYNANRLPIQAQYQFGDGTSLAETFMYDVMGRIINAERKSQISVPGSLQGTSQANTLENSQDNPLDNLNPYQLPKSTAYTYDALGRLLSITEKRAEKHTTETYVYDALGNRISKAVNGVQKASCQYNAANQLIAMTMDGTPYSYAYDRRGNLTEERQNGILTGQYTYDAANRVVLGKNIQSGEQTAYGYNGFDMRIKNIQTLLSGENQNPYTKETDYIPDLLSGAGNDLMSFQKTADVNDAVSTRNIYGIGYELISRYTMPISAGVPTPEAAGVISESITGTMAGTTALSDMLPAAGTKTSFQPDIYGSPLFAVNAQGGILQYIERDIWGNQTGDRNAEGSFPFTTYQYDPVIRKYFAQARFYDSAQGRMLAKDPVKRGLNGYPYCDNDPVDYVDPTGEVPNIIAGGIIGGIVGGIAGFLGNSFSQIKKKEKYSLRKALGAAAKGAITGAAQGALTASGAGLGASLLTNFGAGFLGSMAEQKISKRRVNPREAIREGLISSIGDTLFGNSPLKGIGNAMIRGARSGAAVAAINNIFDSFTPMEQDRIHDFMRNLPPGTTLVLELPGMRDDPRDACDGKNPFQDGVGYGLSNGNGSNGGRKGFSLVDFLKDVAAGAVIGGLSGAAYYGGGKAIEVLEKSIPNKKIKYKGTGKYVDKKGYRYDSVKDYLYGDKFVVKGNPRMYSMNNKRGGTIVVSTKPIWSWSFKKNVRYYNKQQRKIHILSGTHGTRRGYSAFGCTRFENRIYRHKNLAERAFYRQDHYNMRKYKNVDVYDITELSDAKFESLLNGPDVTICAWCFSERSVDVINAIK